MRRGSVAVAVAGMVLLPGACAQKAPPAHQSAALRPAAAIAADIGDDPAFAALGPEARQIVERVLARRSLAALCAAGGEAIKQATRRAVIAGMSAGDVSRPRRAGTAAGRYLSRRCEGERDRF